jgi:hypothetical protein
MEVGEVEPAYGSARRRPSWTRRVEVQGSRHEASEAASDRELLDEVTDQRVDPIAVVLGIFRKHETILPESGDAWLVYGWCRPVTTGIQRSEISSK